MLVSRQNESVFFTTASKEVDGLDKLLLTGAIQATAAVLHHHHIHHRTGYVSAFDTGRRCKQRKDTRLNSKPGHKLSPTNLPLQKPLIHLLCTLLRMDIRNRLSASGRIATVRGKIRLWSDNASHASSGNFRRPEYFEIGDNFQVNISRMTPLRVPLAVSDRL